LKQIISNWNEQFSRTLYIPLVEIPNSSLCPVKAYINMITLIPAENESPAFCILKGKLLVPVTYYLFI
jgi:hypothetical protein